jgi:hypothetical protein
MKQNYLSVLLKVFNLMPFNLKAEVKIEFHCPKEHFSAVFEDRILRSHVSFVFEMFVKLKPKERERE